MSKAKKSKSKGVVGVDPLSLKSSKISKKTIESLKKLDRIGVAFKEKNDAVRYRQQF